MKQSSRHFTVKNRRSAFTFTASAGQTVLSAALESGLTLPHSCRAGHCGSCKARLLSGRVHHQHPGSTALDTRRRHQGYILLCGCQALSDLEIDIEEIDSVASKSKIYPARVWSLKKRCHDVMQVTLQQAPGQRVTYLPGQYIDILLPDNRYRSFSIANAAGEHLELHIRKVENGEFTTRVFNELKVGDILRFYGPLGTFCLRLDNHSPIIMLAGGTGFAPLKAMLEQLQQVECPPQVVLYWGVRKIEDIYMKFWLEMFANANPWFRYSVILSAPQSNFTGRTGLVHQGVLNDHTSLENYAVYASGPPQMIFAAQESFVRKGLNLENFYFDSFDYSADSLAQANGNVSTTP